MGVYEHVHVCRRMRTQLSVPDLGVDATSIETRGRPVFLYIIIILILINWIYMYFFGFTIFILLLNKIFLLLNEDILFMLKIFLIFKNK